MMNSIPPGIILIIAGLLLPLLLNKHLRTALLLGAPALVLAMVWALPDGAILSLEYLGHEIVPLQKTALGNVFATIFAIMGLAGGLYALNQPRTMELAAAFIYAGSAIGVVMAGDIITVFVFWEIMAVASTYIIWASSQPGARHAAMRYVQIHLLGGVILMVGVVGIVATTGSVAFTAIALDTPWAWFVLVGFLINAGAPPLAAWLSDAYPEASWTGAVFLSAFTTKTAVYTLIVAFPGVDLLIYVGLFMAVVSIVYALLENDMRRILAFAIINQVGFMVIAVGIGTEMALNGAAGHAFSHIAYKALLLMSAGSVIYMTGKRKLTELGGIYKSMPITTACAVIGAMATSFPFTAAFASKGLITQAASDAGLTGTWLLLTATSAGVFLIVLKFAWFAFFGKDSGLRPKDPPWNMKAAMIGLAAICLIVGVAPDLLYGMLPYPVDYVPYKFAKIIHYLQLLGFTLLAFFIVIKAIGPKPSLTVGVDWLWRRGGRSLLMLTLNHVLDMFDALKKGLQGAVYGVIDWTTRHYGTTGKLAMARQSGSMVAYAVGFLLLYLVFHYFL